MPTAFILIGSPRKGGNTDLLADAFLEGVREAGGEGEKAFVDDLNIHPIGPVGDVVPERVDIHAGDDFLPTFEKVAAADIFVLGAPVYWQGLPAQLKAFVDRWSCYYLSPLLLDGMKNKVFAALVPHGAPDPDHHRWVTDPIQVWVQHFEGQWAGHISVAAQQKALVATMPEVLQAARDLGKKCVEMASRANQ